jgi:hypothetical protein
MYVSIYITKCNIQRLNNVFNKLKVDYSTHKNVDNSRNVKKSLNHSNINAKYWVACVLVYYNKFMSIFNILKMNGSTMIIEDMWKKLLIQSIINIRF